jgi:hypothetical protein
VRTRDGGREKYSAIEEKRRVEEGREGWFVGRNGHGTKQLSERAVDRLIFRPGNRLLWAGMAD